MISFIVTVLEKDTAAEIKKLEKLEQEHPAMVGNLSKITVVTSAQMNMILLTMPFSVIMPARPSDIFI